MDKKTYENEVNRAIGARIRILRKERDMSQRALGETLSVTFQQLQKYENGTNRVGVPALLRICETLQVSPNDVLSAATDMSGDDRESVAAMVRDDEGARLAGIYRGLSAPRRTAVLAVAKALREEK